MEESSKVKKIFLKDYLPPQYEVHQLKLDFYLDETKTLVRSTASYFRKSQNTDFLFLEGENLKLLNILIDGKSLDSSRYSISETGLRIHHTPDQFTLFIENEINPSKNTSLEGLYISNNIFCTQCEPQGFRKITYFMDRPDVMTKYEVSIEADKYKYPILLSNGDLVSKEELEGDRHRVTWLDPHKKPCYLFALIAGDLGVLQETFITQSGNKVELMIYAAHGKQNLCHHAMNSLIKAMRWDEQKYGLEYDLHSYMIVAIDDFNAGAMENKGLNIFNSKLIMASKKSATDQDYFMIESVVAHEYFHNWTGNRVTLRDWFQLSLKEGLTVFRDQEFSADMSHPSVQRIFDVLRLQSVQFPEDAGPNAHPVRPESCLSVDNFFTSTIYEKGAELIRMLKNIVGEKGFRKGMDTYFARHDGQAITVEDFVQAIADANEKNFEQFKFWYYEKGTPTVVVTESFDPSKSEYSIVLKQNYHFHIPLFLSFIDRSGKILEIKHPKVITNSDGQYLIELNEQSEELVFKNFKEKPILSMLQNFSAPIYLEHESTLEDNYYLAKHDQDGYNKWQATQKIFLQIFNNIYHKYLYEEGFFSQDQYEEMKMKNFDREMSHCLDLLKYHLLSENINPHLKSFLMTLPQDEIFIQKVNLLHTSCLLKARIELSKAIAAHLKSDILNAFYRYDDSNQIQDQSGVRKVKNTLLQYMFYLEPSSKIYEIYQNADNMTDRWAALCTLCREDSVERRKALAEFFEEWQNDPLVLNKWFLVQSSGIYPKTFEAVKELSRHPKFNINNPNHVYSLLRSFGKNIVMFHSGQNEIYKFYVDQIIDIDSRNPQVASRLCEAFNCVEKLDLSQQKEIRSQINRALLAPNLSKNTRELLITNLKGQ